MPISRNNKIRDAWQIPAGRDMLLLLMRQHSMSEAWPEKPLVARRGIASLEKLAGPEFVEMLLDAVNAPGADEPAQPCEPKQAWWRQAVAYRVYLPSFMDGDHDGIGDLPGLHQRLPYLERLGVDLLWISCLQTPMPGAKPVEITEIQPDYGTLEDFEAVVEAAECRGMRVVLDLDAAGNAATLVDGMRFWREHGVYGFCLVNLNLLGKPVVDKLPAPGHGFGRFLCGPSVRTRMRDIAAALREEGELFIAGEVPLASAVAAKLFCTQRGGDLDLLLETGHLMRPVPGEVPRLDLTELKNRYIRWYAGEEAGGWMPLTLQTADIPRIVSRVGASGVYRTVLAKMLGTLLLTMRGTPVLYQGEELGLANTRFETAADLRDERALAMYEETRQLLGERGALEFALAHAGDHARVPFPWSAAAGGGFSGASPWMRPGDGLEFMNAGVQMQDKNSVWSHYARLIDLRHDNPALVDGELKPVFGRNSRVFCYFRVLENEKWYVEINLTGKEIPRPGRILRSMRAEISNYSTGAKTLRPYEANVYRCE